MNSLGKIITTVAIGTLLAVGSAVALLSPGTEAPGMHDHAAVPHTNGFTAVQGQDCRTSGQPSNVALTFMDRWNGQWESAGHDLMESTWTSCTNHWAHGYLNSPNTQPSSVAARRLDLSTLPLMR